MFNIQQQLTASKRKLVIMEKTMYLKQYIHGVHRVGQW